MHLRRRRSRSVQPNQTCGSRPRGSARQPGRRCPGRAARPAAQLAAGRAAATSDSACRLRRAATHAAVEQRDVLEHRLGVLGQHGRPVLRARPGRRTHSRPRGASAVGEQPQPAVARRPTASSARRRRPAPRPAGRRAVEVEQPHVVARCGAGAGGDDQPAAVRRHRAAVVVGRVEPLAPDQHVVGRVGADDVPPDPAVELLLARRHLARRQPADVEERLAAGHPGDGGVAAAVDRPVEHARRWSTSSTCSSDSSSPPVDSW